MRRVYDIAAELQVPVMMHIQTFPHFEGELPTTRATAVRQDAARPTRGRTSSGTATCSGRTSAPMFRPTAGIRPGQSRRED
jgi:hypothetical protein